MQSLKWLSGIRIRTRLLLGFGSILLLMAGIVLSSVTLINRVERNSRYVANTAFPQARISMEIESETLQVLLSIEAAAYAGSFEPLKKSRPVHAALSSKFKEIHDAFKGDEQVRNSINEIEKGYKNLFALGEQIVEDNVHQRWDVLPLKNTHFDDARRALLQQINDLREGGVGGLNRSMQEIDALSRYTKRVNVIFGSAAILLGLLLTALIGFSIIRPLDGIVLHMNRAREGDFTQLYDERGRHDEISQIGAAYNGMIRGLADLFTRVKVSAQDVMQATASLVALARKIRDGSDAQFQSVESASSSIEQMNAVIKGVASSAEELFSSAEQSNSSIFEMSSSIEEIARTTEGLTNAVETVSSFIEQMSSSIRSVAGNVALMSSQLNESSAAIIELDSSVKEVERSAQAANTVSEQLTASVSGVGQQAVHKATEGINNIREVVQGASKVIRKLGERSAEIGNVLNVIGEVADQTNLLALNAAIIAAQAGQSGRGFAVVAEEIKMLANRTAVSTTEITNIIRGIQEDSRKAIAAIEEGSQSVEEGVRRIQDVNSTLTQAAKDSETASTASRFIARATSEQARALQKIAASSRNLAEMSAEISKATGEQNAGTEHIIQAVSTMRSMASQVRKSTVEQSQGAKQISRVSDDVTRLSQRIMGSTKEETRGSEMLLNSIESVNSTTRDNLLVVESLEGMVKVLRQQSSLLQEGTGRFKTTGQPSPELPPGSPEQETGSGG